MVWDVAGVQRRRSLSGSPQPVPTVVPGHSPWLTQNDSKACSQSPTVTASVGGWRSLPL